MRTLYDLPRFDDRWSFVYLEMGQIDKDAEGLCLHDARGRVPIPVDQISLLMLGPGTSITHAAVGVLAKNNCLITWVGQDAVRLYAHSTGGTYSARRLLLQAHLASSIESRTAVARRMYQFRFKEKLPPNITLEKLRGFEGRRVRAEYQKLADEYQVAWDGRKYDQGDWSAADPLNRALSAGNSCLYGVCHAAIVSAGFSAAIGFIHSGKMLSFVYDIADLYKTEISLPVAFSVTATSPIQLERTVRETCRHAFHESKLMQRLIPDIMEVLGAGDFPGESPEDFEGKIVTLADRTENRDIPGQSDGESKGGIAQEDQN